MIVVTGSFVAKADRLVDAIALSLDHVHRSRGENGCISHAVHQDVENPLRLVFLEEWVDRAALTAHFAVPASREFVKAIRSVAVAAPQMNIFDAVSVGG